MLSAPLTGSGDWKRTVPRSADASNLFGTSKKQTSCVQEQIQVLQHKTQEQENVIRQLSQAQSNTPRSKENLNSNLMNLSPSPGSAATPKSRRLHSVKQSTGKHRR